MKSQNNRGLVVLNLALLAILGAVTLVPQATAQNANRGRGEYTMVAGDLDTGSSEGVYIIDSVNAEMIVLRWNNSRRVLEGIGFRSLQDDSKAPIRR
ncbi:MAG: hypothetical protein KF757_06060 [Phycisphaeraceae bacterium]|nr:hypothetical protein [Phycisphaeraceae bacterium]MCW5763738.1 hypothetical protein [Phycisphaeraceae bacterium]